MKNKTCFGSLAYCCGLAKDCEDRDFEIEKAGITKEEFVKLKKQFDKNLKELQEKKCKE